MRILQRFQEFRSGLHIAVQDNAVSEELCRKPNAAHEEHRMSAEVNIAKQAIHDMLESKIKAAEAKLDTLMARAENAKAKVEIKAVAELLAKKPVIRLKLQELKNAGGDRWEQSKNDLEVRITDFEKSLKGIESKVKAS